MDRPPPPSHLTPSASKWWTSTVEAYELHEHHLRLLQLACEAWDRAQGARELLGQEGLTVQTEAGGAKRTPPSRLNAMPARRLLGSSGSWIWTSSRRHPIAMVRHPSSAIEATVPVKARTAKGRRLNFWQELSLEYGERSDRPGFASDSER